MITGIEIKNFKSIGDSGINLSLKPMTVLIGANGSGKSSVLQTLALLKQSTGRGSVSYDGHVVKLSDHASVVHNGDPNTEIEISLMGKMPRLQNYQFLPKESFKYEYVLKIRGAVTYSYFTAKIGASTLVSEHEQGKQNKYEFNYAGIRIDVLSSNIIGAPIRVGGYTPEQQPLANDLGILNNQISTDLVNSILVPALRGLDSPQYALGDQPFDELTDTAGVTPQAHRLSTTLAYRRDLEEQISAIMSSVVQRNIRARLTINQNVMIESEHNRLWLPITNEGMGSNPLLHLVAQLVLARPDYLVMIEEPEIHLHPDAQSRLARELIKIVKTSNKRLLITTHSEHMIYPMMNSVSSGSANDLGKNDLAIYYFDRNNETETTQVKELNQSNYHGALREFFGKEDIVANFLESVGL